MPRFADALCSDHIVALVEVGESFCITLGTRVVTPGNLDYKASCNAANFGGFWVLFAEQVNHFYTFVCLKLVRTVLFVT